MNKDLLNSPTDGNVRYSTPAQMRMGMNNNRSSSNATTQTLRGPDGLNSVVVNERVKGKCGCKGQDAKSSSNTIQQLPSDAAQRMRQFYKKMK